MIDSIDTSRQVGLRRALIGLAIPMASEGTAARLCRAGFASLEEVAEAGVDGLVAVDDIGQKVAASLIEHLTRLRPELERLRERGVSLDVLEEDLPPVVAAGAPLADKTVVVTGGISDPRSGEKVARPAFQRLCEQAGATIASSVSASTDFLITGADVGAPSSPRRRNSVSRSSTRPRSGNNSKPPTCSPADLTARVQFLTAGWAPAHRTGKG